MSVAEAEFAEFVRENRDVLGRAAVLLCRDRSVAEDLVQETLVRVYQSWRRVDQRTALAYARRVMTNLSVDRWRRRRFEAPPEPDPELRADPAAVAAYGRVDARDEVVRALATLSPRERAMVVMRYYHDLSEAEVAREMGVSVGTVKSTCSRALKRLRVEQTGERRVS